MLYLLKILRNLINGFSIFGIDDGLALVASGVASAVGNMFSADKSAEASQNNTKKQLAWERERATNAHQWEVQDLKAAGLNPLLSAGGSGATTNSITPQMPDYSGYGRAGESLSQGLTNAIQANIQKEQLQMQRDLNEAEIGKLNAEANAINKAESPGGKTESEIFKNYAIAEKEKEEAKSIKRDIQEKIDTYDLRVYKLTKQIDLLIEKANNTNQDTDKKEIETKTKEKLYEYLDALKWLEIGAMAMPIIGPASFGIYKYGPATVKKIKNLYKGWKTAKATKATKKAKAIEEALIKEARSKGIEPKYKKLIDDTIKKLNKLN